MDIGFIGVGAQGGGMAIRLMDKGHNLFVCDPSKAATDEMKSHGATVVATPREAADRADITYCCVMWPEICREVALGENGLIHGKRSRIHIEASTVGQAVIERLAADLVPHGVTLIDAPVSGGRQGAVGGTLATIVSGPNAAVEKVRGVLNDVAGKVFEIGEKTGTSQVYKLVNNMMSLLAMLHAGEVIAAGVKAGADPDILIDVLNVSSGRNIATTRIFPERVLNGNFKMGGPMTVALKDTQLFLDLAESLGLPAPISASCHAQWLVAKQLLGDQVDTSNGIRMYEQWAGVEIRSKEYKAKG